MTDRQWTGVVLAGGQSSRMGTDKALIQVNERSLLQHAIDLLRPHVREILVIGDPAKYTPEHATVIPDDEPGKGPLGGLVTALRHARYVRVLVLACDLPNLNDRLIALLKSELHGDRDAVVPNHSGYIEPLAAAYHRHAIEDFDDCLKNDVLKMSKALERIHTAYTDVEPGEDGWPQDLFKNVNAPTDL
ncbi:MAG: molybdenum cofactor guanylyltransferase [Flavobacteriales bacterium]|nr:molybdenum cofactor guanylyltransferase [Flavobacteriales bacterium]MBP6575530.1 molybdenum cofactor guanylyltransferase [Flavobacteriales bacterium]